MKENQLSDSICEAVIACYENNLSIEQAEELFKWINKDKDNLLLFSQTARIWNASTLLTKKEPDISKAWHTIIDRINKNDIRPIVNDQTGRAKWCTNHIPLLFLIFP